MSRRRVEFRLTMPGVGSWNGQWSGAGRNYTIVRTLNAAKRKSLGIDDDTTRTWSYGWEDGWRASITARLVEPRERLPKSDGFCGYDWMVNNILRWGTPKCQHEWIPDDYFTDREEGEWEKCQWCRCSRQVPAAIDADAPEHEPCICVYPDKCSCPPEAKETRARADR